MYPDLSLKRRVMTRAAENNVELALILVDRTQSPANALISNILSIGTLAACKVSSSISICG